MRRWISISSQVCPVTGSRERFSCSSDGNAIIIYGDHTATHPDWRLVGEANGGNGLLYLYGKDTPWLRDREILQLPRSKALPPLASPDTLNLVYRTLLELCPLEQRHKLQLKQRKLPKKYKDLDLGSLPESRGGGRRKLLHKLMEYTALTAEQLLGVPGFILNEHGSLTLTGPVGLLIPIYDSQQRIVAMQIRRDLVPNKQGRYCFLSSSRGVSSGAPVGVLAPEEDFLGHVKITEGFFKGLGVQSIAAPHEAVLYTPGVGHTRTILERCQELGVTFAELLFDADQLTNPNVLRCVARLAQALLAADIEIVVRSWDPEKGKGFDDYLANDHRYEDLDVLPTHDLLRAGQALKGSAYLNTRRGKHPILPDLEQILTEADAEQADEQELCRLTEKTIQEVVGSPLGQLNVIAAPTGTRKTTTSLLKAQPGSIFVLPSYDKILEAAAWLKKHGRDFGIVYGRSGPPDPEKNNPLEKMRWEQAGCERYDAAQLLGEHLYSPCEGCPLRPSGDDEGSCRYWKQQFQIEKTRPDLLLMVPETFFSNELVGRLIGEAQIDIEGKAGYPTIFFDDIEDIDEKLARPIQVTLTDAQRWLELLTPDLKDSRTFVEELGAILFNPARSLDRLHTLAIRALPELEAHQKQLFGAPPLEPGEPPPLNALSILAAYLARGQLLRLGKDQRQERALEFIQPFKEHEKLKRCRLIVLDGTPHRSRLEWFAGLFDLSFVMPTLPTRYPKIIQIPERIWNRSQMQHPVLQKAIEKAREAGAPVFSFKDQEDRDGWWGLHERGLNQWAEQDAPFCVLAGHYSKPPEAVSRSAWILRALERHQSKDLSLPHPSRKNRPVTKEWRTYGDTWRPYQRLCHVHEDPLAEELRRHSYSAGVVQMASRTRRFDREHFLFSGEPIELNGQLLSVELWSMEELGERLGFDVLPDFRPVPPHIQAQNQKRSELHQKQIEDALVLTTKDDVKLTIKELREKLTLDGRRISRGVARVVRQRLQERYKAPEAFEREGCQADIVEKKTGDLTEMYRSLTSLSRPVIFSQPKPDQMPVPQDNPVDYISSKQSPEKQRLLGTLRGSPPLREEGVVFPDQLDDCSPYQQDEEVALAPPKEK